MIPKGPTTQQLLILASLPSGILTTTAAQNALPHLSRQAISAAIQKLIEQKYLVSCTCTGKDRKSEKHKTEYFKVTGKAVVDFFPVLAPFCDLVDAYYSLHMPYAIKPGPLTPRVRDSYTINRLCRIIECEQFCSAAGVRTLIDMRDIDLPAVFGKSEKSPVCRTQLIGLDLNEAACEMNHSPYWSQHDDPVCDPVSDFCFYRSVEISRLDNPSKDPTTILSPAVGILSSRNRALTVYCTPRYGGMSWMQNSERKFVQSAMHFARCAEDPSRNRKEAFQFSEAILFYRNDRELINFLLGKRLNRALDYGELGNPYQRLYAIPFTMDGMKILRHVLLDPDFYHKEIMRVAEPMGQSAKVYSNMDYFAPLCILGHNTFCALPLNITLLATLMAVAKGSDLPWFLGYPMYDSVFRKLFPECSVTGMPMPVE